MNTMLRSVFNYNFVTLQYKKIILKESTLQYLKWVMNLLTISNFYVYERDRERQIKHLLIFQSKSSENNKEKKKNNIRKNTRENDIKYDKNDKK